MIFAGIISLPWMDNNRHLLRKRTGGSPATKAERTKAMQVLLVTSSIFGAGSKSRDVALAFVDGLRRRHPNARVVERDVGGDPLPHVTADLMGAAATPAVDRTPQQAALAAQADALIDELEAADVIVLAVPMYNFSVPSTFKAWIDHVARAGRTFRYTETGPQGLLRGKQVFVAGARGGVYGEGPARALDFHETYLRGVLGFLGLTDVTFVHAEGQAIGPDVAAENLAAARDRATALVPAALAA
jgi:FMN-dependent NADH-azoreductase